MVTKSKKGRPPRTSPEAARESRLFDMPYSATAPRLLNPDLGLHALVTRAGHNAGYSMDVTLLDAPDHRLIRTGVLLAHRVLDGRGEWYLGAPDWAPLLPDEEIVLMGQPDIPQEFTDLIAPFRRRATLGPVAALTCERREFALRGDGGSTVALLRDDRVTVRRGGLTTARFREVTATPINGGLSPEQSDWLAAALAASGATEVEAFPQLAARLGAPATGPTDYPDPTPFEATVPFETFVSTLLITRVREMVVADLAVRAGQAEGARLLAESTTRLIRELAGLSSALDPRWTEDLDEELEWLAGEAEMEHLRDEEGLDDHDSGGLAARLRGGRYLSLLERLVTASRAPKVGDSGGIPTGEVVAALIETRAKRLRKLAGRLVVEAPAEDWEAAEVAASDFFHVSDLASLVATRQTRKLMHRMRPAAELLISANRHGRAARAIEDLVADATPAEAFEAGRSYEHERAKAAAARDEFVQLWPKIEKKTDIRGKLDL